MSSRCDPARWLRVQQALDGLFDLEVPQRVAALAALREQDAELAADVAGLLAESESPRLPDALPAHCLRLDPHDEDGIGRRFGPFVVDVRLGEGGSGVVYRAHREGDYARTVAIKRLAGGRLDTVGARRLQHERDVLARLDHPGIVRLIDAGLDDGSRPFLVLEYVDGDTFDRYLAQTQPDAATRLGLFLEICDAVAYAHQRLLVHRDLKPGNVMVTRTGRAKLLDYGIAKLLESDAADSTVTRELGAALTPAWAAPEQLRGEAATTATDVHALGLLLYQTLCGAHPFHRSGQTPAALDYALRERDAPPLAQQPELIAMPKAWRHDLARVAAKALDKQPGQRYASAHELAEDIRAVRDGRPVRARHASAGYVLRRFVGRHRIAAFAAALAVLALLGTTTWALRQSHLATLERARAERRFEDVHHFASTVLFDYQERIRMLSGSMDVQRRIVADALRYLESLHAEAGDDPALLLDIAQAYQRVGDIQGNSYGPNLGDFEGAARSYERMAAALARLQALGETSPSITLAQASLASRRADMAHQASKLEDARRFFQAAIGQFEALPATVLAEVDGVVEFASVLDHYGDLLGREGGGSLNEVASARQQHGRARALREAALLRLPGDARLRFGRYQSELRDGEYWLGQGDMRRAEAALSEAAATVSALAAQAPDDLFYRYERALVQSRRVPVLDALGRIDASIDAALDALATTEALLERDPDHDTLQQAVSASAGWAARQLLKAGRAQDAVPIVQRQRAIAARRVEAAPDNPEGVSALSVAIRREGDIAEALGDHRGAIARHREALALQDRHAELSPDFMQTRTLSLLHIGRNQTRLGEAAEARRTLAGAVADFTRLVERNPEAVRYRDDLAQAQALLAEAWLAAPRDRARAWQAADAAFELWAQDERGARLSVPAAARRDGLRRALAQ